MAINKLPLMNDDVDQDVIEKRIEKEHLPISEVLTKIYNPLDPTNFFDANRAWPGYNKEHRNGFNLKPSQFYRLGDGHNARYFYWRRGG